MRIEIGPRDLEKEAAMLVRRDTGEKEQVPLSSIANEVIERFAVIQFSLLENAKENLKARIFDCNTVEEIKEKVSEGIAHVPWCGEEKCGLEMDEQVGAGILGIPTDQDEDGIYKCPMCGKDTSIRVYVARTY